MSKFLYPLHFNIRKFVNYIIFQIYYRFKYRAMMPYKKIFKAQCYSGASVRFLEIEFKDLILSRSVLFNSSSIVVDVGGDTGIWAEQIYSKYEPNLYIFEPHPGSVKILEEKFSGRKAKIFSYGLGSANTVTHLSDSGMGSSVYDSSPDFDQSNKIEIEIRDISEVLTGLSLDKIDLIKINIEGGEYDLLPRMIETGIVKKCRIIRIQFHDWIPDAFSMRKKIVKELSKTHDIEWSYPMVWESWILKDMSSERK